MLAVSLRFQCRDSDAPFILSRDCPMKHLITLILSLLLITCATRSGKRRPGSEPVPLKRQRPWMKLPASTPGLTKKTKSNSGSVRSPCQRSDARNCMIRSTRCPSKPPSSSLTGWRTVRELQSKFNYEALDFEAKTSYDLWIYQYEQARDSFQFNTQNMSLSR